MQTLTILWVWSGTASAFNFTWAGLLAMIFVANLVASVPIFLVSGIASLFYRKEDNERKSGE